MPGCSRLLHADGGGDESAEVRADRMPQANVPSGRQVSSRHADRGRDETRGEARESLIACITYCDDRRSMEYL